MSVIRQGEDKFYDFVASLQADQVRPFVASVSLVLSARQTNLLLDALLSESRDQQVERRMKLNALDLQAELAEEEIEERDRKDRLDS